MQTVIKYFLYLPLPFLCLKLTVFENLSKAQKNNLINSLFNSFVASAVAKITFGLSSRILLLPVVNGTHILVYPFLIFPTSCAFEWVSPNSPLPSPDNLCKRHYGKCKNVYSMQITPFLNHFLRANAKNIIGSKLKLKFWTKKKLFWISWTRKVYKAVWIPISNRVSHIHHNTH